MRLTPTEATRLRASRGATARDTGVAKKRARRPRPEKAIQRAILDFLATIPGVYAFKTGTGMFPMTYKGKSRMVRMGKVGVADIVGWREECGVCRTCNRGKHIVPPTCCERCFHESVARFLAIEVKRPGELPTPEQAAFLTSLKGDGGWAIVAHSVDDVVSALGLAPRGTAVAAP